MPTLIYPKRWKSREFCSLATILPIIVVIGLVPLNIMARTLRVGPGEEFTLPSIAAVYAKDGDIVEIKAATYTADAATWTQNDLTIRGIGSRAVLDSAGVNAQGKAIWVISGNNVTIQNVEFLGARVPDGNGAGIRMEAGSLIVKNCVFRDNQNGILTNNNPSGTLEVKDSEFSHNGAGQGQTHNIYVGRLRRFIMTGSYSHHANVGHNVKSRAIENYITYNRIMDELDGRSSYAIDLSNGGTAYIIGNVIQEGQYTENSNIISFGSEGYNSPRNELYFINNTVVNDRINGGYFLSIKPGIQKRVFRNNLFVGKGTVLKAALSKGNLHIISESFLQRMRFNYHLRKDANSINASVDPGIANGINLTPLREYQHVAQSRTRSTNGLIDIGAFEYHRP